MSQLRNQIAVTGLVALVLVTCAILAVAPMSAGPSAGPPNHLFIGFLLGSLFGHTFLASAWIVFGPGSLKLRLPWAIVWAVSISLAILTNSVLYGDLPRDGVVFLSQLGIFGLAQCICWIARWRLGHFVGREQVAVTSHVDRSIAMNQFGIKHLMIVTTVIAITIALGRVLLAQILPWLRFSELAIFVFLVLAACLICVPVLFSLLSRHCRWLSLLILICFLVVVTFIELPLLSTLSRNGGGPDWLHILLINLFTLLPVVIFSWALRYLEYRFVDVKPVASAIAS